MKQLIFVLALCLAVPAWADHELETYVFKNVFVYDNFSHREKLLKIVVLNDDADLKVAGAYVFPTKNIHGFSHLGDYLIMVHWGTAEVLDLADPKVPLKVAEFVFSYEERKIQDDESTARNMAVLDNLNPGLRKAVVEGVRKQVLKWSYRQDPKDPTPTVYETEKYLYQVRWEEFETGNDRSFKSGKYLVKISKETGKEDSRLLLGSVSRTVCSS